MDTAAFERMVVEALELVPEPFRRYLDTVEVVVEAEPSPRQRRAVGLRRRDKLYGLYEGMTVPDRLSSAGGVHGALPSIVTLFRRPLAADFPDEDELLRQVRRTLFHELAHHFGIEDRRLEELGAY